MLEGHIQIKLKTWLCTGTQRGPIRAPEVLVPEYFSLNVCSLKMVDLVPGKIKSYQHCRGVRNNISIIHSASLRCRPLNLCDRWPLNIPILNLSLSYLSVSKTHLGKRIHFFLFYEFFGARKFIFCLSSINELWLLKHFCSTDT